MNTSPYYTVKDIAEMFQVAETTVRQWIREGDLPAIAIGKGWRVTEKGLTVFLESRRTNVAHFPGSRRTDIADDAPP